MPRKMTLLSVAAVALLAWPVRADKPAGYFVDCSNGLSAFVVSPQEIAGAVASCRAAGGHITSVIVLR